MSGKPIDGVVQALIEVAVGKVQHLYRGTCPDAIEGFDSRDPQCPACRVLIAAQQQGQAAELARPSAPVGVEDVDALAQEIRRVDGEHSLGASALAEALVPYLARTALAQQPAAVDEAYPTPRNRAEAAALARLALAHLGVIDAHIDAAIARCETNSAAKHQEPKP